MKYLKILHVHVVWPKCMNTFIKKNKKACYKYIWVMVFNATFNNISGKKI